MGKAMSHMSQSLVEEAESTSTQKDQVRSSGLPLAVLCPASTVKPRVQIDSGSQPALLGTAVHEIMARACQHELTEVRDLPIDTAALKHRVPVDELTILSHCGLRMWKEVEHDIPRPLEVEIGHTLELSTIRVTGHLDLLAYDEAAERVIIIDWKSGWKDSDYFWQMVGYALLAQHYMRARGLKVRRVTIMVAWLRTGQWEPLSFDPAELLELSAELEERVRDRSIYAPGEHCGYCKRFHECEARSALARRVIGDIADNAFGVDLSQLEPSEAGALWNKMVMVEKTIKVVREAYRDHLRSGATVATREGWELAEVPGTTKSIKAREAWSILIEACGERLADAITVKKGEVEQIVADGAGRGKKKAAKEALIERLESAGAIETKQTRTMREVRIDRKSKRR